MTENCTIPVIVAVDDRIDQYRCSITSGQTTVAQVLERTDALRNVERDKLDRIIFACFGEVKYKSDVLNEGDRLEVIEKLKVDPTVNRRQKGKSKS